MPQIIRELFEQEFAMRFGSTDAIAVNSGTSALIASLWALDLRPDDEIITTPFTFQSTSDAIIIAGGKPVFVDIKESDHLIDESKIRDAITDRTKAILPVHLFGRVCRMDTILELRRRFRLVIIEDAAQALGVKFGGRYAGTIGDLGCFSFYKTKNLSTFEGGMISVNTYGRVQSQRLRAICDPTRNRSHEIIGFNFRMPEPCALIGYERLKLHFCSIDTELGKYDERNGYYPSLVYQNDAYARLGITGNCPIAEAAAAEVARHHSNRT